MYDDVPAYFALITSIGSSVTAAGFAYGIMREKVHRLTKDVEDLRRQQEQYVPFHHFEAVVEPMKRVLDTVQKDIKEILRAVSAKNHEDSRTGKGD